MHEAAAAGRGRSLIIVQASQFSLLRMHNPPHARMQSTRESPASLLEEPFQLLLAGSQRSDAIRRLVDASSIRAGLRWLSRVLATRACT